MEAAIRFSKNCSAGDGEQRFLRVDVTGKSFRLCNITRQSKRQVQYDTIYSSSKIPAFRAFDWHPLRESIVAVGGSGGDATLLNITDNQQESVSFSVRSQRLCNAVALSPEDLIAVGLDRVRTDNCLNIWDFSQRLSVPSGASTRSHIKNSTISSTTSSIVEPLRRLAPGEPISSLKFFNSNPRLLAAGVKGQFVRLYDLRDPSFENGLQFATRCVHNLAVDTQDENYFASCFPSNDQMICIWDRRMNSRAYASLSGYGGGGGGGGATVPPQSHGQPEPSLEIKDVTDSPGTIWSLRFSKSRRGCLGVLLSSGHLRTYSMQKDFVPEDHQVVLHDRRNHDEAHKSQPEDVYLDRIHEIERSYMLDRRSHGEKKRIVSFDFMTSKSRDGQPKLIVLTGEGDLRITSSRTAPEPVAYASTGYMCKGYKMEVIPLAPESRSATSPAAILNKIRRTAEPRNALKTVMKQAKHSKTGSSERDRALDLKRMSSFANHSWNSDLGFQEKVVPVVDLLTLVAAPRLRCEAGYLLDARKNKLVMADSQWVESYWNWLDRAERISRNNSMVQDNLDLAFVGIYNIWMEEIATGPRQKGGTTFASISSVIKTLSTRLNLPSRKGCSTEYPWHRKLCLYISGLSWSRSEIEVMVQKTVTSGQHTKAAAIAMFAEEEKLAFKALRSRTAAQGHKMLAMAIAGRSKQSSARKEASKLQTSAPGTSLQDRNTGDTTSDDDSDWTETIASLSSDLTDPYARAILAYVKTGNWEDVVNEKSLPLKHRVGIALRHLADAELTKFIGEMTREVIASGDIEGIVLTGTGTREGLELLQSYARTFNDLQTAILGLSVGGAARRFLATLDQSSSTSLKSSSSSSSSSTEDRKVGRRVEAMREAYRSNIMSWGLKFDRVRFDIASARALNTSASDSASYGPATPRPSPLLPKPKEQIRLICTYCTQSLTQFSSSAPETAKNAGESYRHSQGGGSGSSSGGVGGGHHSSHQHHNSIGTTVSSQASAEKAAVIGTACPKCGRHLPRCGVCDLWLGMPDETFAKWYTDNASTSQQEQQQQQQQQRQQQQGRNHDKERIRINFNGKSTKDSKSESGTSLAPVASQTGGRTSSPAIGDRKGATANAASRAFFGGGGGGGDVDTDTGSMTASTITAVPNKSSDEPVASNRPTQTQAQAHARTQATHTGTDTKTANSQLSTPQLREREQKEAKAYSDTWMQTMHKFTVFCVSCSHGFHAHHAKMWFEGGARRDRSGAEAGNVEFENSNDAENMSSREGAAAEGGGRGHRFCPVPGCGCMCNG